MSDFRDREVNGPPPERTGSGLKKIEVSPASGVRPMPHSVGLWLRSPMMSKTTVAAANDVVSA